jgi:hypothetical protein
MTSARKAHETDITTATAPGMTPDGWSDVVRRFAPYVAAVARAHRLPEAEAELVFAEVFLRTWTEIDRLAGDEAIRGRIVELAQQIATEQREALGPMTAAPPEARLEELRRALMVSEALRRPLTQRRHGRSRDRRRRSSRRS